MKKYVIVLFFLFALGGNTFAQKSDLSITVKGIKDAVIAGYTASGKNVIEKYALPVFVNGKGVGQGNYEALDEYSLADVKEITISFDKQNGVTYGLMGTYGIIHIQLIENKE